MPTKERWAKMSDEQRQKNNDETRAYRLANPEAWRAIARKSYLKKVGQLSRQSSLTADPEITKEKKRISNAKWQKSNPEKLALTRLKQKLKGNDNAKSARRRATKKNATPLWADLDLIKDVYQEAKYMQMDVDHIYPLAGKYVCGLHVWDNLQLLPKTQNIKKSNSMPTEEYVSCLI
jgi:hypothetical protein